MVKEIDSAYLDRAYGALGFEFHQNRLKKFKKGEVVLCMGVGNNYDLPFGWESPFIYSKFVHVFDEHFVATEDGRFSIDRIFKVDKEYRFFVPQIDMHFISYFRMNVILDKQQIHFNFIDKNPTKESFSIPVDATRDYIKNQLAYIDGIKLFELRISSKNVATKKVKPVPVPSSGQEPKTKSKIDTTAKRDKKSQKRDEMIKFRVTAEVKELIQELAKYDQCTVAELLKRSLKKYGITTIRYNKPFDFSKLEIIQ